MKIGGFEWGNLIMVFGLTMIKVRAGYEKSVYDDLRKRAEIKDIYSLFGEFNFFLVMQAEGESKLDQLMKDIKREDMVVKTGPIMVTFGNDLTDTAFFEVVEKAYS
jgi:DNA-binding Lrp family transcriptional regulator